MNTMTFKGFKARIMEAERLVGDGVFGLPPGSPLEVYESESFIDYPKDWMSGPGVFVVPVRPNKGLWLDWTENDVGNTAVLPSIKGCNPITGQKLEGLHLERYDTKCPKHGCDFQGNRYCPECDYKWPPQSYVSHPSILWLDGFLNVKDGTVRQFFFTEDELRDIPSGLIGKENTVPAFGFAFYSPKERRPSIYGRTKNTAPYAYAIKTFPENVSWQFYNDSSGDTGPQGNTLNVNCSHNYISSGGYAVGGTMCCADSLGETKTLYSSGDQIKRQSVLNKTFISSAPEVPNSTPNIFRSVSQPVKDASIGAGAKIRQSLEQDPYPLESWKDQPDAVMTIYFVFQEKFEELKSGGMRDLSGKQEGMLAGMPVG